MRRMAIALVFAGLSATIHPCCAVSSSVGSVHFRGQQNIIVWDRETKTQHFIRNAQFETKEKDLSFIAPTPTVPELAEANPRAFKTLHAIKAALPRRDDLKGESAGAASAPAGSVVVVLEQKVAGYDAVVLRSDDPKALKGYLDKNGYQTSLDIEEWFQHYIDKKWVFTAFKVATSNGVGETGLVRMSFKTDRPFNPYYVPESNRKGAAMLGIYVISDAVMELDRSVEASKWLGQEWEAQIPGKEAESIGVDLGVSLPEKPVVVFYGDFSFPSEASEDLWFIASDRDPRSLPSPEHGPGFNPLLLGLLGGGIAGFVAWFATQRSRS